MHVPTALPTRFNFNQYPFDFRFISPWIFKFLSAYGGGRFQYLMGRPAHNFLSCPTCDLLYTHLCDTNLALGDHPHFNRLHSLDEIPTWEVHKHLFLIIQENTPKLLKNQRLDLWVER